MNGYKKILITAFILLILSILNEKYSNPINNNINFFQFIHIYLLRYFHLVIFLYSSFYLLFFMGYGKIMDRYIFLIFALFIVIGWNLFDSCWLSYLELLFYNINLEKVKTTFHPTFYSIFNNYDFIFITISGIFYFFTVTILLFHLKTIKFFYKLIYYALFLFLFIYAFKEIKGTNYYSLNNKFLLIIRNFYKKYISFFSKIVSNA